MSKKVLSEHQLTIEVTRSFPLHRIKEIHISDPTEQFRQDIKLTKENAEYLSDALKDLLHPTPKKEQGS